MNITRCWRIRCLATLLLLLSVSINVMPAEVSAVGPNSRTQDFQVTRASVNRQVTTAPAAQDQPEGQIASAPELHAPTVSPTGQIAFAMDGNIYLHDLSTGNTTPLTSDGDLTSHSWSNPTWTWDGSRLAAELSGGADGANVYTMLPDGSDIQKLTGAGSPAYGADGALYFIDGQNRFVRANGANTPKVLYAGDDTGHCYFTRVSISTDGQFALSEWCNYQMGGVMVGSLSNPSVVVHDDDAIGVHTCNREASWSPTSNRLAFVHRECGSAPYETTLYAVTPPSKDLREVASGENIGYPAWSPDGHWLVYSQYGETSPSLTGLWVVSADGGKPKQISSSGETPVWRPFTASTAIPIPPTPTPLPPTPTATPDIAATAQPWINEKAQLIPAMQQMDINAGLFTVPAVAAYNEQAAQQLLNRIRNDAQAGTLTPQEVDAFGRLTLQERSLFQMLPHYTAIAGTLSDSATDSVEIVFGLLATLKPSWGLCTRSPQLCKFLHVGVEGAAGDLVDHAGDLFVRLTGSTPDDAENGSNAWHLVVTTVRNRLDVGASLKDLVKENGIQALGTRILIEPYLHRSQALMDKGVLTADLSATGGDHFPMTGGLERDALLVRGYADLASIQVDSAASRAADFKKGADVTKVAEDISDLVTLSPLAAIAAAVGIGARIEHLAVNTTLYVLNAQNLGCVEYLSTRAATSAFDSQHPSDSCENRSPTAGQYTRQYRSPLFFSLISAYTSPALSPLAMRMQDETTQYQQAVQDLVRGTQAHDATAATGALERLNQSQGSMDLSLRQAESALLSQPSLDPNAQLVFDQGQQFRASNLTLYLAAAENWMASETGKAPQTDLAQVSKDATDKAGQVQQSVAKANPVLPAGVPNVLFSNAQLLGAGGAQLQLDFTARNFGTASAPDTHISLLAGTAATRETTPLGSIDVGQEVHKTLQVQSPSDGSVITAELWAGDRLMDTRQLVVTAEPTVQPAATPTVTEATPSVAASADNTSPSGPVPAQQPAATQSPTNAPDNTIILIAAAIALAVILIGATLFMRGRRQRS